MTEVYAVLVYQAFLTFAIHFLIGHCKLIVVLQILFSLFKNGQIMLILIWELQNIIKLHAKSVLLLLYIEDLYLGL